MTGEELAAIRERNEERKRAIVRRGTPCDGEDCYCDPAVVDVARLLAEVERLKTCDGCGKPRSLGVCSGHCDNDE